MATGADILNRAYQAVQVLIGTLSPGGGTSIYPAAEAAYFSLVPLEAKVKHIILLTDGLSTGGDYDTLTSNMRARGSRCPL